MRTRTLMVAALVAIGPAFVACGSDDSDQSAGTTNPAAASSSSDTSAAETSAPGTAEDTTSSDGPPSTGTTASDTSTPATTAGDEPAPQEPGAGDDGAANGEGAPALTGEETEVADMYQTVFDSTAPVPGKVDLVENGAQLESVMDEYATAGEIVGGIGLDVSEVSIQGDSATVTYQITFADTPQYDPMEGEAVRAGGAWQIPRGEFCDFVGQAGVSCP